MEEFITKQQFQEQPKAVQKVLLKYFNENLSDYDLVENNNKIMVYKDYVDRINVEGDSYPLFTEGKLRRFIENKTDCKIETVIGIRGYCFVFRLKDDRISIVIDDLLQAYWKVACEIAKDITK